MTRNSTEWACTRCNGKHSADFYMPHGCRIARMTYVLEAGDGTGFWELFTPSQEFRLRKAARKVAGPWTDEPEAAYPNAMARRDVDGACVADAFRESKTAQPIWIAAGAATDQGSPHGECASLIECRAAADAALRAAGWVLVDGEVSE